MQNIPLQFGSRASLKQRRQGSVRCSAGQKIVFALASLLLILDTNACLAGKSLRVGIYDLPPVSEIRRAGVNAAGGTHEVSGFFPALLDAIAEKAEWNLIYLSCSRKECLESLSERRLDLLVAAPYEKDLAHTFHFTSETLIPTWAQVYAHAELAIQSWFDLNGREVGIVKDDPYNVEGRAIIERFGIKCKFIEFKGYQDVLIALEKGWVDVGIVDRFCALSLHMGENVVLTPIVFAPIELRFAVLRGQNEELIATLDYYLHTMKRDSRSVYYVLLNQFFGQSQQSRLPVWVLWGLSLGGGFVLLLIGMNLLLQQQVSLKTAELSQSNEELKHELLLRRAAENRMLESNRKFQILFEFSPDAILLLTGEGYIFDCNLAAESLTEYAKNELMQMSIQGLIWEKAGKASHQLLFKLFSADVYSIEVVFQRKHGGIFPAEVRTKSLELNGSRVLLFVIRDLTQQKKIEEEILRVRKLESINLLAGGIAHDFNNMLTAVLGNVSLARMYAKPGDRIAARLEAIEKAVMRARDLTFQLLTFAKGGLPVKETTSLISVIRDSCDFALRGSNVLCNMSIAEDLWPVDADVGQISQVLNNMMINAKEAMPDGGIIELVAENKLLDRSDDIPLRPGRYVLISIKDHGSGIPQEHLSRIFDPYFTTKTAGHGLGLATSHSIIRKHDGHIIVKSHPGAGAIFDIYLPASERELSKAADVKLIPTSGRGKILIMDDDEMIRNMASEMLSHLNYKVHKAKDGFEAIEAIRQATQTGKPFDAVIMDLTIPGGYGGKEVIKEVRKIDPQIKAIVSSGYSNDPIMADFAKYGFDGVVTKPYGIEKLSEVIHRVISFKAYASDDRSELRSGSARPASPNPQF